MNAAHLTNVPPYDCSSPLTPPSLRSAAILELNQQTICNWIDQGSLPALRVGRRVRVLRRDLEQLAEAEVAVNELTVGAVYAA